MNQGALMDQSQSGRDPRASAETGVAATLLIGLIALAVLLLGAALYAIFALAPVDQPLGVVQKIFYFHVPSINAMYLGFITCSICSAVYLKNRDDRWDAAALAAAEVAMLFCLAVLITGSLWARKAWGVWWAWDPALTSTLLEAMIFFAYLVLRAFGTVDDVEKRFAAGLAIVGLLNIPVIEYSVQRWRGTHPTLISGKGGGSHSAVLLGLGLFIVLSVVLIWVRARGERLRQRVIALELEAAERGLLEEV
jgi:heme exporter protein C